MFKKYFSVLLLLCLGTAVFGREFPAEQTAERDTCVHLDEIVVTGLTGSTRLKRLPSPVSLITRNNVFYHSSTNIIDAVSRQAGVSQITTGSGISKPVIRGLGYNRVLIINEGVRQEGQQWGDEHGVELDGQNIGNVEIIKGPASLIFGSDALAGVMLFHSEPFPAEGQVKTDVFSEYQTNNGLNGYSLHNAGKIKGFVWNLRWSDKNAHDYKAPVDGYVPGTRFSERAANLSVGADGVWGHSHLLLGAYRLTPGMTETDDLSGTVLESKAEAISYKRSLPFQEVGHYRAVSDNLFYLRNGSVKAIFAYQQNRRQEFEESADASTLYFRMGTATYDVKYTTDSLRGWKLCTGVQGMYQQSRNLGEEYLIPAYRLAENGLFLTMDKSLFEKLLLSGGIRFDKRQLSSESLEEEGTLRFEAFDRSFDAWSASIGAVWNVADNFDLRFNLARGFRAPNMSELGSNGVHEGTFRYEKGNHSLKAEFSLQADLGLDFKSQYLDAAMSLFASRIDNYIFLRKSGALAEGVPVYVYDSGNARLAGGEAVLVLKPLRHLQFTNAFSYVRGILSDAPADMRDLPMIPAPRLLSSLHYDIPSFGKVFTNVFAEVDADVNFRQNHFLKADGTETASPAYTVFDLSLGTDLNIAGRKLCTLCLVVSNLADKAYIPHLSRFKYMDASAVTGHAGLYEMGRNFTFRLAFPIL